MITQLEGYKGNLRKFVSAVSESIFNADKLQFTDESGSNLPYRMNNVDGAPIIKHDVFAWEFREFQEKSSSCPYKTNTFCNMCTARENTL